MTRLGTLGAVFTYYARDRPGNRGVGDIGMGGGVGGKSCSEVQVAGGAGLNG